MDFMFSFHIGHFGGKNAFDERENFVFKVFYVLCVYVVSIFD